MRLYSIVSILALLHAGVAVADKRGKPRAVVPAAGAVESAMDKAAPVATLATPLPELPGEKEFTGCHKYPASKRFRWGVRGEVGVAELVASVGEIGCQAIVVGAQVSARGGKVTLEVPDLLTAGEVYRLFYSALEVLGLTVEQSGKALKIVDLGRAKEVSRPLAASEATPHGDQWVTRLLRVKHASLSEIQDVLNKLRSTGGDLTPYAAASALVVTDRATVVRRMEELLRQLDVSQVGEKMWTISTHGQTATELSATIDKILDASRKPGAADKGAKTTRAVEGVSALVPVDGAHLVVVVGSEAGFHRVAQLAGRIDPPIVDDGAGQAHVVYLAYSNAKDIAQTLEKLGMTGRGSGASTRGGASSSAGAAAGLQGDVRLGPDEASNSIVVFAGGADFLMVRDLIAKLDVPRRQVYVEATILDISVNKARELGLSFHGGTVDEKSGTTAFAGNRSASANSLVMDASTLASALGGAGFQAGVFGTAMKVAGVSLPSFGVVLHALELSKDVNVISRPHLLTMDNTKAILSVGQKIPFASASFAAPGANNTIVQQQTFKREEVALKLEIWPHLNSSEAIRLEIDGEISDVPDGQTSTPAGPTTNSRTIKTMVVVNDGESVVLGGLQKESESQTVEKIPFLGDIPLLGPLFRTKSKQRVKQDLLIVLTPYIIRSPEDLRRIAQRRDAEHREFLERFTAFQDESKYDARVDYKRKRGLLQEINLAALAAERDSEAVRAAARALRIKPTDGLIDDAAQRTQ